MKPFRLCLPHPAPGGTMLLGAEGARSCRSLQVLAHVMDLPIFSDGEWEKCDARLRDEPPDAPEFTARGGHPERALFYREAGGCFSFVSETGGAPQYTNDWKTVQTLGSLHTLTGETPFFLMHGTLLEVRAGEGIFLFGPSGMGKSTTMARHRAAGGECFADDAAVFTEKEGRWYASPMPTYSCCLRFWSEKIRFPFARAVEVKALCLLDRSDTKEEIVCVPRERYLAHLSDAQVLHYRTILPFFPDAEIACAGKAMLSALIRWEHAFRFVSLRANLGGNIAASLAAVMQEAEK